MKRPFFLGMALALALTVGLLGPYGAYAGPGVGEEEEIPEFVNPPKPKVVEEKPVAKTTDGETVAAEDEVEEEPARILTPAEVIPEKCPFFAMVPRVSRLISGLRKTAVAELVAEREVVDFISKLRQKGMTGPGGSEDEVGLKKIVARSGFTVEKIESIFAKQVAVAVLPGAESFRACAVFVVDDQAERAQEFIGRLVTELKRAYPGTVDDSYWDGDIEVRTLETQWGLLSFVFVENLLVLGYGKDALDPVIALFLAEKGGKTFAENPDFKKAYAELGKGSDFFFQFDLAETVKAIPAALGQADMDLAPMTEMMGMQGVGLVAGASRIDRSGIRDTIVMYPAKDGGKFLPFSPRQKSDFSKVAAYVPLNAIYFAAEQQDFAAAGAAAEQLTKTMKALSALPFGQGIQPEQIGAISQIIKQLSPAFGGQVAAAALRTPGKLLPEAVIVLGVNDTPAATDLMKRLETAIDLKFQETKYTEHDIRYAAVEKGEGLAMPLAYTFSATGDLLIAATSLDTLKKAIRQKRFGRTTLLQKEDFKRVTDGFAVEKSAIAYLDLSQVVELVYSAVLPVVGMAAQGGQLNFTAADLPSTESITKHLFGVAWYMKVDDDKAEFQSYGPAGMVSAAVLGVGYAVPMVMDRYAKLAQEESKRKLAVIGMGLHLFASDNDRFPASLSELYPMYVQDLSVFRAPRGAEIKSVDDIATKGGYVYVPGRQLKDLSDSVLVFEKRDVNPGGRHVLRLGMSIRYYKTRGFERMFKDLVELENKKKD